ncbi:MAG: FAD:protein FMN transferase [Methylococcaceae bacterium]|nr:FAD:protein FMN transferase [Methylococcaceae bacterium]
MDIIGLKRGSVLLFLVFLLIACEQQRESKQYPLHYSDAIFGTSFTIKASLVPSTIKTSELRVQVKQLLDKLNGQMSTYQADSELSIINANQSSEWLTVSTDLYSVLRQANEISKLSQGAFDITIGPLVNLWGFGPDPMSFVVPEKIEIDRQLKKTGYKKLLFDDKTHKIKKLTPELYVDLSAIAKGYAVDQVGLLLETKGISNYMVEIGGELRLKGKNISNEPWRIAVEKPAIEMGIIQKVLPLSDISLATSGDYRNFFESDGVRFSHTIDPRFGMPIKHKLASITILSDTTMKADALATALMVLGAEEGYKMAEQENIAALFIIKTEDGFKEKATPVFLNTLR